MAADGPAHLRAAQLGAGAVQQRDRHRCLGVAQPQPGEDGRVLCETADALGAVEIGETEECPMNYEANIKLFVFSKSILPRIKYIFIDYNRVTMSTDPFLVMFSRMIDKRDPSQRKRKVDNLTCLECIITFIKVSIPWRMLPQLMHLDCSYTTIYKRYAYWVKNRIIEDVWKEVLGIYQSTQMGNY